MEIGEDDPHALHLKVDYDETLVGQHTEASEVLLQAHRLCLAYWTRLRAAHTSHRRQCVWH